MVTGETIRVHGNVKNTGLITNLPDHCCMAGPCLVDRNGAQPCYVGDLPSQLAALNRTNVNVQSLVVEAALHRDREAVCQAVMVNPPTSAVLTPDQIRRMVDEMFEAESCWLPEMQGGRASADAPPCRFGDPLAYEPSGEMGSPFERASSGVVGIADSIGPGRQSQPSVPSAAFVP